MEAFRKIREHIANKQSFVLEAGAGAGKTYVLIQTLNFLIESYQEILNRSNQKIVCITFTNVAKNEIIDRLENSPLVLVSTIHEFLWDTMKPFQKQLKEQLCILNEKRYNEEVEKKNGLKGKELSDFQHKHAPKLEERITNVKEVQYNDSSFRNFEEGQLHHDDVISLSNLILSSHTMLSDIIIHKYPFILVDEYQDTAKDTAEALIEYLSERNKGYVVVGFYGDSHQKIYKSGVGSLQSYVDSEKLKEVKKEENYRSAENVVTLLNRIRTNIAQKAVGSRIAKGTVKLYYYPNPPKELVPDKKGKLKEEGVRAYEERIKPFKNAVYDKVLNMLSDNGWDIREEGKDKVLVLANRRVAERAGFGDLYNVYATRYGTFAKEELIDREHSVAKLFVGSYDKKSSVERETGVEHLITFWREQRYNEVISFISRNGDSELMVLDYHEKKQKIKGILETLTELRESGTVEQILSYVLEKGLLKLPESVKKIQERLQVDLNSITDEDEKSRAEKNELFYSSLMKLPYREFINLFEHTQNHTVFSTKHGTKGEEYRNVFAVLDDTDWKQEYNFNGFFDNTDNNEQRKEMSRNLFYVTCSRAKENLVILMLSPLSPASLEVVRSWFGYENVINVEELT